MSHEAVKMANDLFGLSRSEAMKMIDSCHRRGLIFYTTLELNIKSGDMPEFARLINDIIAKYV